jgi:hypothetical protein
MRVKFQELSYQYYFNQFSMHIKAVNKMRKMSCSFSLKQAILGEVFFMLRSGIQSKLFSIKWSRKIQIGVRLTNARYSLSLSLLL